MLSSVAVDFVLPYRLSALRVLVPAMPFGGLSRGAVDGTGGGTAGAGVGAGEEDHHRLRLDAEGAGEGTAGVTGTTGTTGAAALGGGGKCAGFISFTRAPVLSNVLLSELTSFIDGWFSASN